MANESKVSRRALLAGALGTALAISEDSRTAGAAETSALSGGAGSTFERAPSAAAAGVEPPMLTLADIERMLPEISNWGRWGKNDEMGTVNLITPAHRKRAASLVREGISISLAHDQSTMPSIDNAQPLVRVMNSIAGSDTAKFSLSTDTYTMNYHGYFYSHMDALCHFAHGRQLYNGTPSSATTSAGASKLDITAFKDGIVTLGILLDIPRLKGVPYLEPGTAVLPEDLDAWEKQARVKVSSGDMVMLRTGRWARRAAKGPWAIPEAVAGLHVSCVRWLKQRDVSVLASDAVSDVFPSRVEGLRDPIHCLVIVGLGTPLFDNLDPEETSETANRLRRWEFMFTAAPMRIPGGTGSPINPLAIF
jgi:kynurenine formamidase